MKAEASSFSTPRMPRMPRLLCLLVISIAGVFALLPGCTLPETDTDSTLRFTDVAVGSGQMIALDEKGNVWSWGANYNGELGREPVIYENGIADGPGQVEIEKRVTDVEAAYDQCFAVTDSGHVYAWGGNSLAQLALNPRGAEVISRPGRMLLGHKVESLSVGTPHVLALTESGEVLAWGGYGSLFLGTGGENTEEEYNDDPDSVVGLPADIVEVAAGAQFSLARSRSGKIFGWGYTEYGELGIKQYEPVEEPVQLSTDIAPSGVSAGINVIGVYSDNGVFLRGRKMDGQRGCNVGNRETSNYILDGVRVKHLDLGGFYGLALTSEGKIYSWGRGGSGQLGARELDDSKEEIGCPRLIEGIPGMVSVSAGAYASAAIDSTGRIWTWGSNEYGELGRPDSIGTDAHVPPGPVVLDPEAYPKDVEFDR